MSCEACSVFQWQTHDIIVLPLTLGLLEVVANSESLHRLSDDDLFTM